MMKGIYYYAVLNETMDFASPCQSRMVLVMMMRSSGLVSRRGNGGHGLRIEGGAGEVDQGRGRCQAGRHGISAPRSI